MRTLVILFATVLTLSAQAADSAKKAKPEPSREQREKMAASHDKMAACLRSDKSMKDCHEEMKKDCMAMGDECPMMGRHGKGMMMKHGEGHEESAEKK